MRRHESHCLVSGLGWTALSAAALVAAALKPAAIDDFWPAFDAVLVVAVAFGLGWGLLTGRTDVGPVRAASRNEPGALDTSGRD